MKGGYRLYYEIIYENGEHSIAEYENDGEAELAIGAHVDRAKAGLPGTPDSLPRTDVPENLPVHQQTWAAQRVVKVLKYDEHPYDYGSTASNLTKEVASKTVDDCIKEVADENGIVDLKQLCAAILETTEPRLDSGPHESNYKMKEVGELKWPS
jgi:hypothetical protein